MESRFLTELSRRGLFDLAVDYAQSRTISHRHEEGQAYWTDRLAQVYRQRTWEASAINRQALTQQSADLITEFLGSHAVRPETSLAMRLTQVEVLLNLARINLLLHSVGHRGPDYRELRRTSVGILPLVRQAEELVEALQRQLQRHRGQLARQQAGMLRERAGLLSVQLAAVRWLTNDSAELSADPSPPAYQDLRDRSRAVARAARQAETRQAAARLLAELQIAAGDAESARLILRNRNALLSDVQRFELQLRLLLRQGKASEALKQIRTTAMSRKGVPGELTVLELESLLMLRMQADGLQDEQLIKETDGAFQQATELVQNWLPSVWKDAAVLVIQRYELTRTVGAEVAELVEQVDRLQAAGNLDEAARLLRRSLRLLPANAPSQARGGLQLRLGELLITQQQWEEAQSWLQPAVGLFEESGQSAAASTAALLDAYCIGQRWRLAADDPSLKDAYLNALIQHRERWASEATQQQSTEWLVRLTQQTDPLHAAAILAEQAAAASTHPERLQHLITLGEQLISAQHRTGETRSSKPWAELVEELSRICAEHQLLTGELTDQSARLLLLEALLATDVNTPWEDWSRLQKRLPHAAQALVDADGVIEQRLFLLQLIAAGRTTTDAQVLQQCRQRYLEQARQQPLHAVRQLAQYLRPEGRIQPGDSLIAGTMEQLTGQQAEVSTSADELSELLQLATLANRVTHNETIRQQLVSRLLKKEMSSAQASQIAAALMTADTSLSEQREDALVKLWKRIRADSEEGSDLWLEACLQLAQLRAAQGQTEEAIRQLRVISVIHPEWGSAERKRRVESFLRQAPSAAGENEVP